ncbi:MAG TPA: hypothetical protein VN958_21965, partial [Chitinophagaceae bacterium]|nr:hypothetical protein [Chitinophagaceae bacterium]
MLEKRVENCIVNAGKGIKRCVISIICGIIIAFLGSIMIYYISSNPGESLARFGYVDVVPDSLAAFSSEDLGNYQNILQETKMITIVGSIIFCVCPLISLYHAGGELISIVKFSEKESIGELEEINNRSEVKELISRLSYNDDTYRYQITEN